MKNNQPIIIIKKKVGGHAGHHGGAWKVAYADFVTAMMAFFLVMWIMGQSKSVKAGVAGYFKDPGIFEYEKGRGIIPGGQPGPDPMSQTQKTGDSTQALQEAAARIQAQLAMTPELKKLSEQVDIQVTSEGLRIQLIEGSDSTFFDSGSAVLKGQSERMLGLIASELGHLKSAIILEGHTDSRPYSKSETYTNWELSADRANAARRVMERAGLQPHQVLGVRGYADTQLRVTDKPLDPRNRRISIVVRGDQATPEGGADVAVPDAPAAEPAASATPAEPAPAAHAPAH